MKKKTTAPSKLRLSREALRKLQPAALDRVLGGTDFGYKPIGPIIQTVSGCDD